MFITYCPIPGIKISLSELSFIYIFIDYLFILVLFVKKMYELSIAYQKILSQYNMKMRTFSECSFDEMKKENAIHVNASV